MKNISFEGGGYGRSGFNRFRSSRPKPVEFGKEYDVTIDELSRRGEGVAKVQGFIIFVPETRPGQQVKIRITRVSDRFADATVVKSKEAEGT